MTKIKVAQFVSSMNCGGTETMLMNIFRDFNRDNFEFIFVENTPKKTYYTNEIFSLGGRIKKISSFHLVGIKKYIYELIDFFKSEKIDVVHSHTFLHSGIVLFAAKKAGVKIRIAHSHSAMKSNDNNKLKFLILQKLILKNATNLIACSTESGLCLFGKKFKENGVVLHNPIQLSKIINVDLDSVAQLKNMYSIRKNCLIIGHVGRLVDVKNHKFMLEIAKKLKHMNFSFKMFFLGEGELRSDIENQIKKNKLNDYVILTGNVSNVYKYMKLFDLLLLPSFYEGLPVTLIEAQASNLKCLISDNISKESDLGLGLIKFLDISNIDVWINEITHFNKEKSLENGNIYKKIIELKFDSKVLVNEYENLYIYKQ